MATILAFLKHRGVLLFVGILASGSLLFSGTAWAARGEGIRWFGTPSAPGLHIAGAVNGTIAGKITKAADGSPIPGALVVAHTGTDVYLATSADANGSYSFAGLMPGSYQVSALASGFLALTKDNIIVTANATTTIDFALEAAPPAQATGSLTGQAKDASAGNAVAEATVLLLQDANVRYGARADANGLYLFSGVAVGAYQALAFAPSYLPSLQSQVTIAANAPTTLNFDLSRQLVPFKGTIVGKVTNAANGHAIAAARVSAKQGSQVAASATTDANGSYSLADLIVGTYSLQASATGFLAASQDNVLVSANSITAADFALNPTPPPSAATGSLTGLVVNVLTRSPIVGAEVKLELRMAAHLSSHEDEDVELETVTDAQGKFSFAQLEPGIYRLEAEAGGFHKVKIGNIAVLANQTSVINLALRPKKEREREAQPRGNIAGRVTDVATSQAIAGATVFFTPSHGQDRDGHDRRFARTDSEGRYRLEGVLVGTYELHVRAEGYRPTKAKDVRVRAEETVTVDAALEAVPRHDQDQQDKPKAKDGPQERGQDDDRDRGRGREESDQTHSRTHAALEAFSQMALAFAARAAALLSPSSEAEHHRAPPAVQSSGHLEASSTINAAGAPTPSPNAHQPKTATAVQRSIQAEVSPRADAAAEVSSRLQATLTHTGVQSLAQFNTILGR